jgi:Zn-finger protein
MGRTKSKGERQEKRINFACRYYPCHNNLEDCTFCYCPFYPCQDKTKGGKFIIINKDSIWDCSDCNYIHKKIIVDKLFRLIRLIENDFIVKNKT